MTTTNSDRLCIGCPASGIASPSYKSQASAAHQSPCRPEVLSRSPHIGASADDGMNDRRTICSAAPLIVRAHTGFILYIIPRKRNIPVNLRRCLVRLVSDTGTVSEIYRFCLLPVFRYSVAGQRPHALDTALGSGLPGTGVASGHTGICYSRSQSSPFAVPKVYRTVCVRKGGRPADGDRPGSPMAVSFARYRGCLGMESNVTVVLPL